MTHQHSHKACYSNCSSHGAAEIIWPAFQPHKIKLFANRKQYTSVVGKKSCICVAFRNQRTWAERGSVRVTYRIKPPELMLTTGYAKNKAYGKWHFLYPLLLTIKFRDRKLRIASSERVCTARCIRKAESLMTKLRVFRQYCRYVHSAVCTVLGLHSSGTLYRVGTACGSRNIDK